jgi:neutral ceramidase
MKSRIHPFLKIAAGLLGLVLLLFVLMLSPIDRRPLEEQPFYHEMVSRVSAFTPEYWTDSAQWQVGWSRIGIIPDYPMPMAGYRPRDKFTQVHDSLFLHVLTIFDGTSYVHFLSFDLLIVPPALADSIRNGLDSQTDKVYFGASHTHNGLGGWDQSLGGRQVAGAFHPEWLQQVRDGALKAILEAKESVQPSSAQYLEAAAEDYVANRLRGERRDGLIRGMKFSRADNSTGLLYTYSAHPTSISSASRALSGDYPAAIHGQLYQAGIDFPMFMAGMVGSHKLVGFEEKDFDRVEAAGRVLGGKILEASLQEVAPAGGMAFGTLSVSHGPSQMRVAKHLKVRDFVFAKIFRPLEAEISCLRLGNVLWIGISADFSGEIAMSHDLHAYAQSKGLELIITSFNGKYTGYLTCDDHYDEATKAEVREMNWVGPYFGQFYGEILRGVIDKMARS